MIFILVQQQQVQLSRVLDYMELMVHLQEYYVVMYIIQIQEFYKELPI